MASDLGRANLLSALNDYFSVHDEEMLFKERFIGLIKNFDNCFNRELKHAHVTGSAWILDESMNFALMTHHAKLDKWLQLGGHADGQSDIRQVALREAQEESGLTSVRIHEDKIFDLDIHTIPARKSEPEHEHFDIRYLFLADKSESVHINEESKEISWIPLIKLDELTGNNRSIIRMAEKTSHIKGKVSPVW